MSRCLWAGKDRRFWQARVVPGQGLRSSRLSTAARPNLRGRGADDLEAHFGERRRQRTNHLSVQFPNVGRQVAAGYQIGLCLLIFVSAPLRPAVPVPLLPPALVFHLGHELLFFTVELQWFSSPIGQGGQRAVHSPELVADMVGSPVARLRVVLTD